MAEYRCWIPEHGDRDDGRVVHAANAWHAAKIFAAEEDSDSGCELSAGAMRGGYTIRIHVLAPDAIETTWDVTPEATIQWYARAAGVVQSTQDAIKEGDANG